MSGIYSVIIPREGQNTIACHWGRDLIAEIRAHQGARWQTRLTKFLQIRESMSCLATVALVIDIDWDICGEFTPNVIAMGKWPRLNKKLRWTEVLTKLHFKTVPSPKQNSEGIKVSSHHHPHSFPHHRCLNLMSVSAWILPPSSQSFPCSALSFRIQPAGCFFTAQELRMDFTLKKRKSIYLFILAAQGLSCGTQDLHCSMWAS